MSEKHNLELNKIAASILLAGVIAMVCGFIADGFYRTKEAEKRGFHVEVVEDTGGDAGKAAVMVDVGTLLASADAAKGESIAQKKCTSCHDFTSGGPNKVGPNLYGIVGAKFAHKGDFPYSDAVKNHGGTWGYEELNHWLHSPAGFIKGNKMGFAGLKNDQERADVIMYLKSISPGAPSVPAPNPTAAAEDAKPAALTGKPVKNDSKTNKDEIKASKDVKNPEANQERKSDKNATDTNSKAIENESHKADKKDTSAKN